MIAGAPRRQGDYLEIPETRHYRCVQAERQLENEEALREKTRDGIRVAGAQAKDHL